MPQTPAVPPPHIPINKPSFNCEGAKLHDSFRLFKEKCNYLLVLGLFKSVSDTDKVSTFLNWLGPKLYGILNHLVFPEGKSKKVYQNVIDQFTLYFKSPQSIIQSWYQLGNLTSALCKNQTEFINRLLILHPNVHLATKMKLLHFCS